MRLTVIGCGDAFGSGGRLQSAYLLDGTHDRVLIDCGATVMTGLARQEIDPNSIAAIVVTHLHGDHFAGLAWLLIHAAMISGRRTPLDVYGPADLQGHVEALAAVIYPGISVEPKAYSLRYRDLVAGLPQMIGGLSVTPYVVDHAECRPSYAVRIVAGGTTFAFSGDTIWTEALVDVGRGADLFLMDCHQLDQPSSVHLNWITLRRHIDRIGARRFVLTHMSDDMLARQNEIEDHRVEFAADGAIYDV